VSLKGSLGMKLRWSMATCINDMVVMIAVFVP